MIINKHTTPIFLIVAIVAIVALISNANFSGDLAGQAYEKIPCTDSDGNDPSIAGKYHGSFGTKGTISGTEHCRKDGEPTDTCIGEGCGMAEFYCEDEFKLRKQVYEGGTCDQGVFTKEEVVEEPVEEEIEEEPIEEEEVIEEPIEEEVEEELCTETDDGQDYYNYGKNEGYMAGTWTDTYDDMCRGSPYYDLVEYYCDGKDIIAITVDVPEGYMCQDGAFILKEEHEYTCTDSDGGQDYYTLGITSDTWYEDTYDDMCRGEPYNDLVEYYCDEDIDEIKGVPVDPPEGYKCEDGIFVLE